MSAGRVLLPRPAHPAYCRAINSSSRNFQGTFRTRTCRQRSSRELRQGCARAHAHKAGGGRSLLWCSAVHFSWRGGMHTLAGHDDVMQAVAKGVRHCHVCVFFSKKRLGFGRVVRGTQTKLLDSIFQNCTPHDGLQTFCRTTLFSSKMRIYIYSSPALCCTPVRCWCFRYFAHHQLVLAI